MHRAIGWKLEICLQLGGVEPEQRGDLQDECESSSQEGPVRQAARERKPGGTAVQDVRWLLPTWSRA